MCTRALILSLLLLCLSGAATAEETAGAEHAIETVLALGPLPIDSATLAETTRREGLDRALLARFESATGPRPGSRWRLFGEALPWQTIRPGAAESNGPWLWLFTLEAERFVRGKLSVEGLVEPRLFGEAGAVALSDGVAELNLAAGSHRFWLVHGGADDDESPELFWRGKDAHDQVRTHIEPDRRVSARRLTNAETVTAMALSPDARFLALSFSGRSDAADMDLRRTEIRDLREGRVVQSWAGRSPRSLAWSPDGAWLAVQDDQNNLWLLAQGDGQVRLLLGNQEHIGSWRWHPDSASILLAWTKPHEPDNSQRRRLRSLEDRWASFRDNSQLFQLDVGSGLIRPLTAGKASINLQDIHPDGDRLLLSERLIDYAEPPHSLFRVFELSLPGLQEREIGQYRQLNAVRFAGDGYWLLAGPGLVQGDGATTMEPLIANEYDTQLYRLSADGQRADSLSRDFDPAFSDIHRLPDGDLLLTAIEGERVILVRFDVARQRFSRINAGLELVEQFVASDGRRPQLVVRGTDAAAPQRVVRLDLARNQPEVLVDSRASQYADVRFGAVEPWSFTNADGDDIEGRYYLPPDFDPEARYPLIVYYYGGTTPVNRQFTGRYPFHLWAAHGYVIYVLQPRGTIGYGQRFSALHVNAWGRYTADDILEGTERFIEAHDFIDGERVANIGASYGGFMTMHLATLTDRFAASISHAGISALTSYWGQGWWGYGYSGIASRGSFPWNNPELYVGQSPVYAADRITTPLLLLTGDADTNVPPGESHNMYTALKLLGREVELIEFPGEDHWIIDREKRYIWWDTMLAWFDKWLKDQPEWWHHLYPETAPANEP